MAILIGKTKFYLSLISKIDYDKRKILSAKDFDTFDTVYLKYHFQSCLKELMTWQKGSNIISFVLAEILEAIFYLHSKGYVHRDVKG